MDPERLVKISRNKIPVGRKPPGHPKRRWSYLSLIKTGKIAYKKIQEEEEEKEFVTVLKYDKTYCQNNSSHVQLNGMDNSGIL